MSTPPIRTGVVGRDVRHQGAARSGWRQFLDRAWPDARPAVRQEEFRFDALLILLLWVLLNWPVLSGRAFLPWDSAGEFFPQARFVVESIRGGQAPWWNPFSFAGIPVFGDPQGLIFAPQVLVGLIAGRDFNLYIFDVASLIPVLFGGIALARYGRAYADSRTLPILGALVFMVGGAATSRLEHTPQIISYSLLPLQLLALRAVCLRPTLWRLAALAFVLTAGALNPTSVTFLSAVTFLPFAVLHLYESRRRLGALLCLAGAAAVAIILALPVLSAISELISISNRSAMDISESYGASLPLMDVASLFLPGLYGVLTPSHGMWPPVDLSEDFLYIGIIPVMVLVASLVDRRGMTTVAKLCWLGIVGWLVFMMGMNTPLYPFLYTHVPGFSEFRRPADGEYMVNLLAALLIGCSRLPAGISVRLSPRLVSVGGIGAVLVCGLVALLAGFARARGHGADLLVVLGAFVVRLLVVAAAVLLVQRSDVGRRRWLIAPIVLVLTTIDFAAAGRVGPVFASRMSGSDMARAYSGTLSWRKPRNPLQQSITFLLDNGAAGSNPSWRMLALSGDLSSSMPMAFRILSVQGANPVRLRAYEETVGNVDAQSWVHAFGDRSPDYDADVYRMLGLRYVLFERFIIDHPHTSDELGATVAKIRAHLMASDWARRLDAPGSYEVWELKNAKSRALVLTGDGQDSACTVLSYGTVSVSLACHAPSSGRLVLGDSYAPGWRACVDGVATKVEPFMGFFRSVAVPQGASRVDFQYQPVPFLRGDPDCRTK